MLKRNPILIIGIILLIAILLFIATDKNGIDEPLDTNIIDNEDMTKPPIIEAPKSTEEPRYIRQLKFAYEGRMNKTKPIIGENVEQYLDDSFDMYYFLGGLAFNNGDMQLLTNGYLDDDNNPVYGDVVVIIKDEAYGIKTGMSIDEVKNALGDPNENTDYSLEHDESELYGRNTTFTYDVGDYQVVIVFDALDKNVAAVHLNGSKNNLGYPTSEKKTDLTNLSQEELDVYNRFKSNYDEEDLRGLEPLSVMKLYIRSIMEKDYETEWELFIKEEKYLGWDKEHHMSMYNRDIDRDYSVFENAVNIRYGYDEDGRYVSISFEDKYLQEYDNSGYPFRFSFGLAKNKDEIWKVVFLPMQ